MENDLLKNVQTVAIVGLSDNSDRPSYEVATYLKEQGFRIIPVNPNYTEILGEKVYPDLASIPNDIKIDIVDVFRRSEDVMPHVKEAVERGVKTVWLQEGITNPEAEEYARSKGVNVVSNFCLMKAHRKVVSSK